MERNKEMLMLAGMCVVVILLSLGGLGGVVASGMIRDLDGLLLAAVCLSMAGVFSLMLAWLAWDAGWLARFKRGSSSSGSGTTKDSK
jgi:hypothetical protein